MTKNRGQGVCGSEWPCSPSPASHWEVKSEGTHGNIPVFSPHHCPGSRHTKGNRFLPWRSSADWGPSVTHQTVDACTSGWVGLGDMPGCLGLTPTGPYQLSRRRRQEEGRGSGKPSLPPRLLAFAEAQPTSMAPGVCKVQVSPADKGSWPQVTPGSHPVWVGLPPEVGPLKDISL